LTSFEGHLSARVPILSKLIPDLQDFDGMTRLKVDFGALALLIERATFGADARDGRRLIAVDLSAQEPLRVQLPQFAIDWNALRPQSLSLRLDRLPVAWVSPYLPEIAFRGGEVSADLKVAAGAGQGVRLTAAEPVTVKGLRLAYRDFVARQAVTATL